MVTTHPPKNPESLPLVAKMVVVSSMAYYGLDEVLVTDGQFDEWCRRLHEEWDNLDPVTKWKLGDPHSIHTSGFHIKCTDLDLRGLLVWLKFKNLYRYHLAVPTACWKINEQLRFRYCTVGDVQWDRKRPIA